MKLSEYIEHLQELQNAVGDLPVKTYSMGGGGMMDARAPQTEHLRLMTKRESVVRCWQSYDGEEKKGEKVVRI